MEGDLAVMDPKDTAQNYDAIAAWWLQQMKESTYGVAALERTLTFVGAGRHALDVGCGCEGRFFRILLERGFNCTGLDISKEMIALATQRYPTVSFVKGDICKWSLTRQ
jgi:ubiquinone/menaquinone biosynthesis C-methylase UbiE